ncbi:hypothetical protein [Aeoliella mucimassa]|uniref:Uncharacterized protein n=1 Tax=Aeoliella mucimassa TaxID=2527972 RepID=A0A518AUE8_9BACT|nr:hypothetical protein [Aeoliella mucimassa]QDU58347.1 hypothetical protein Pan181_45810 [Aeoliella mucimassa]
MAKQPSSNRMSLVEEYFSTQDERFVETLRQVQESKLLAVFANRWRVDTRPWAREQKIAYLRGEPNCIGHQTIVKRLFKQAEEDRDHGVVAACAAMFDRLVQHRRRTRYLYDWRSRTSWQEEYLFATCPRLPYGDREREGINPFTGEKVMFRAPPPPRDAIYFSYRTRYYLQRRAWRYFRRLATSSPEQYVDAATTLLMEYQDEDFSCGERILDSWTLLQLAFREHLALEFGRARIHLAEGASLNQLKAAPRFRHLWQTEHAFEQLMHLLQQAPSRLVRVWAMQLLEQHHQERVALLPADELLELMTNADKDIQNFADRLLKDCSGLDRILLEVWLDLIERAPPNALELVCQAIQQNVSPDRLTLTECTELALREPTPIASLGLRWMQAKPVRSEEDFEQVARLANVRCLAIAKEAAEWALSQVGSPHEYDRDHVSQFFDSLVPNVRLQAWSWLESPKCPGSQDPVLFCRLLETPYDELRLRVVDLLEKRNLPGEARSGLIPVWTAVLLGVHRGGRQKLKATRQLAAELIRQPNQADELLPVLAAAVRSIRKPEARAGIAAVVSSLSIQPDLHAALERYLPELEVIAEEASA